MPTAKKTPFLQKAWWSTLWDQWEDRGSFRREAEEVGNEQEPGLSLFPSTKVFAVFLNGTHWSTVYRVA